MTGVLAASLTSVLFAGILTQWMPQRWTLAAFDVALFGIAAFVILERRLAIRVHPIGAILGATALWGPLQIALGQSVYAFRTWEAALGWTASLAAFGAAMSLLDDRRRRERFLFAVEIFALVLAVVSTLAVFTSPDRVLWVFEAQLIAPAAGPFPYKNQYAAFIEAALGVALAGAIWDRRHALAHIAVAAALAASVIAAGSRAGAILCLAEIIAVPVVAFARGWIAGRTLAKTALASLAAAATLTVVVGWGPIWARLQEPNPYSLRADLVRSSLEMIAERPLTGFGLGTWSTAYPGFARFDDGRFVNQAHNDWVQWAAEGGVLFALLLAAVFAVILRHSARAIWGLGLAAVFLHALVDYPFQQRPALAAFFFALAGALAADATSSTRPRSTAGSCSDAAQSES